jgi:hypothetical protein
MKNMSENNTKIEETEEIQALRIELTMTKEYLLFFKERGIDPEKFIVEAYKKSFEELKNPKNEMGWVRWTVAALGAIAIAIFAFSYLKNKKVEGE